MLTMDDTRRLNFKYVSNFLKHTACLSSLPRHGRVPHAILQSYPSKSPNKALTWVWQERFLIYKSQKDRFNIHEQSVPSQWAISVTGGQYDDSAAT